jgi:hypothetical protein
MSGLPKGWGFNNRCLRGMGSIKRIFIPLGRSFEVRLGNEFIGKMKLGERYVFRSM